NGGLSVVRSTSWNNPCISSGREFFQRGTMSTPIPFAFNMLRQAMVTSPFPQPNSSRVAFLNASALTPSRRGNCDALPSPLFFREAGSYFGACRFGFFPMFPPECPPEADGTFQCIRVPAILQGLHHDVVVRCNLKVVLIQFRTIRPYTFYVFEQPDQIHSLPSLDPPEGRTNRLQRSAAPEQAIEVAACLDDTT